MAIFTKQRMVWSEPWFFCQRIRDRSDWFWALLPAAVAFVAVTVILFYAAVPNLTWWQNVGLGLALGGVIQLGIEAALMRREITLDDRRIEAFGNAGQFHSYSRFPLDKIVSLQLRRPDETGLPCALLVIQSSNSGGLIGIPNSLRLERLALLLHELGQPVTLSGWSPPVDGNSPQNEYVYQRPAEALAQTATFESVPEAERNLTPLPDLLLALFIGVGFVLFWLVLLIAAGIWLFLNRQFFSIWTLACAGIAMFASLVIPFTWYDLFGDYFSSQYLIGVASRRVRQRSENLVANVEEPTFPVETIHRETWTSMGPKVLDFGFLQVERPRRRIVFEGNRERWKLPFESIEECHVEEIQYGTAGEGTMGELRCYVVVTITRPDGPWEIGLRPADKEIGRNTDTRKMRKAVEVFDALTEELVEG